MDFIRKRMESYIEENDKQFVKAQDALNLFEDLEEIETVQNYTGDDKNEKKIEIKIVEKGENIYNVEEQNEEKNEDKNQDEKEIKKEEEEKEIKIEEDKVEKRIQSDVDIEARKKNNNIEKKLKPGKTRVEKKVKFNIDEEALKKKNQRKKEKKQASDFVRQLTYMKELIKQ